MPAARPWTDEQDADLLHRMSAPKATMRGVAADLGVSYSFVQRRLAILTAPVREMRPAYDAGHPITWGAIVVNCPTHARMLSAARARAA